MRWYLVCLKIPSCVNLFHGKLYCYGVCVCVCTHVGEGGGGGRPVFWGSCYLKDAEKFISILISPYLVAILTYYLVCHGNR